MKKHEIKTLSIGKLCWLAWALAASSGAAMAQSTVTVFGVVDVGLQRLKNGSKSVTLESIDGLQTSRLGFRGSEDMGGGLTASFHLEGALGPDTGGASFNFARRSTVSVASKSAGELRLGRDYTPTFWSISRFTPFGTNGVGNAGQMVYGFDGLSSTSSTIVRSSNSVGYFLPSDLGGVYGQLMYAPGEGVPGRYQGFRVGYAQGPVDVAVAASSTVNNAAGDKFKVANVGGTYDFGAVKLFALYHQSEQTVRKQTNAALGATAPVGSGLIRAGYIRSHLKNSATGADYSANQLALGYVHYLSKRTALYTTAARIHNGRGAAFVIPGGPALTAGQTSTGYEAGLFHSF